MANIKVGDEVRITNGALSGALCVVGDILRGAGAHGDLYVLCTIRPFVSSFYEDEFEKVGEE